MLGASESLPVIFNLSGCYDRQDFWKGQETIALSLRGLEESSFFCGESAERKLREVIEGLPEEGIHFIDSGDYHYISLFFLERIKTPFTLIQIDHHSDCRDSVFGAGLLSCGGWVAQALRSVPNLQKVWLIGPGNEDGMLEELSADSRICVVPEDRIQAFTESLPFSDRTMPVYISLDKDVLSPEDAATDWSQGGLRLDGLTTLLHALFSNYHVCGFDVCGEALPDDDAPAHRRNNEANRRILAEWRNQRRNQ